MTFKNKNWPLIIGTIILLALCFVLIFPEWLTSKNPYGLSFIKFWVNEEGSLKMATAPYPPSAANLLGSDQIGRDLFSFLLYGCRLTLLLAMGITVFRFILAIPVGIAAGMSRPVFHRLIDRFNLVFTTIPPLLVAIIILRIDLFSSLYKIQSIGIFILTLTLVGWSKIASVIERSTASIMAETYILAERAIGKSEKRIAREHVLPHLRSEVIILFFMEIASALTLLMQLGLFSIFVGNLKIIKDSSSGGYSYFNVTFEPEWSSLLGSARDYIRVAPWIALSAGAVFFLTVLGFNLFGEGLRLHFQKHQQSKPTPLFQFFNRKWRIALSLLVVVVVIVKWPSSYGFDSQFNSNQLLQLKSSQDFGIQDSQKWIETQMSALDLAPLNENGYQQTFDKKRGYEIDDCQLKIGDQNLIYGKDYIVLGSSTLSGEYKLMDFTETFYSFKSSSLVKNVETRENPFFKDKMLFIDTRLVPIANVLDQVDALKGLGVKGLLVTEGLEGYVPINLSIPIFSLTESQTINLVKEVSQTPMVKFEIQGNTISGKGINFFCKIDGKEPTMAHNTLVLGMDYQGATKEIRAEKLAFYFNLMANLKAHQDKINRTLVFALFDSTEGLTYYSEHALVQNKNVNLYLDLTDIDQNHFDKVAFSDALSPISRYYGFVFANQFKKNAKNWLDEAPLTLNKWDSLLFDNESLTTLNIKTVGEGDNDLSRLGQLLIKTLIENTY